MPPSCRCGGTRARQAPASASRDTPGGAPTPASPGLPSSPEPAERSWAGQAQGRLRGASKGAHRAAPAWPGRQAGRPGLAGSRAARQVEQASQPGVATVAHLRFIVPHLLPQLLHLPPQALGVAAARARHGMLSVCSAKDRSSCSAQAHPPSQKSGCRRGSQKPRPEAQQPSCEPVASMTDPCGIPLTCRSTRLTVGSHHPAGRQQERC